MTTHFITDFSVIAL